MLSLVTLNSGIENPNIWKQLQMECCKLGKKTEKDAEMNHWLWRCYQRTGFGFLDYARIIDSWQG